MLSVLLSLSILLCIGTGVLLRFQENRSSQQVSLSSAHAPAGQQATQPSDPENAQASFDIGQQTTDAETQADSSTAVRLPTASALKKPAAPAKDQAILDEVAQAMEDELNSGGKKRKNHRNSRTPQQSRRLPPEKAMRIPPKQRRRARFRRMKFLRRILHPSGKAVNSNLQFMAMGTALA